MTIFQERYLFTSKSQSVIWILKQSVESQKGINIS